MPEQSAGIVMYRRARDTIEVLLVHPGGPFWRSKDAGAWSIPKGVVQPGEESLAAALREFAEETGAAPPTDGYVPLGAFRQPSRKIVTAFAIEGDLDLARFRSNLFSLEWPPRSGRTEEFPEADRAAWFTLEEAREKILVGQEPILTSLASRLAPFEG